MSASGLPVTNAQRITGAMNVPEYWCVTRLLIRTPGGLNLIMPSYWPSLLRMHSLSSAPSLAEPAALASTGEMRTPPRSACP